MYHIFSNLARVVFLSACRLGWRRDARATIAEYPLPVTSSPTQRLRSWIKNIWNAKTAKECEEHEIERITEVIVTFKVTVTCWFKRGAGEKSLLPGLYTTSELVSIPGARDIPWWSQCMLSVMFDL